MAQRFVGKGQSIGAKTRIGDRFEFSVGPEGENRVLCNLVTTPEERAAPLLQETERAPSARGSTPLVEMPIEAEARKLGPTALHVPHFTLEAATIELPEVETPALQGFRQLIHIAETEVTKPERRNHGYGLVLSPLRIPGYANHFFPILKFLMFSCPKVVPDYRV
jgi:hypothetical protein